MIDRMQTNVEDVKKKHSAILSAPQTDESESRSVFSIADPYHPRSFATCLSGRASTPVPSGKSVRFERYSVVAVRDATRPSSAPHRARQKSGGKIALPGLVSLGRAPHAHT